ncbi:serine/threonine-protein phosphatase 6 regulatory ankyrin repeat subunit B-like [Mytilus trossulus]|uniref:serine/threonine-protein phosphatase 6 regulatory ankyrin repeat subunit B-like n=1 Tax=Mytilus trossulus TaxID=6551 RepID=UPI003007BB1D
MERKRLEIHFYRSIYFILQSLNQNRGVIITGSPGCGKSIVAHHVALTFEKEGYEIIPCDGPSDILKHFTAEKIQVFVIDDICGKFGLNQHKADFWEQNDGKLNMLLRSSNENDDNDDISSNSEAKFIITCRENIYSHKAFPKLKCFSLVQCSFSTTYKISPDEMRNIALSDLEHLVKAICRDAEIESNVSMVSIQNCLKSLQGIYITESEKLYTAIHDKMFDIISAAIAPSIMNCLIEYVDIAFIAHRIQLSSCGQRSLPFVVYIPPELEESYLKRQYNEALKGNNWEVFGSRQTENQKYRKLLLSFLKEQDTCKETTYVVDKDGATPLFVSSYLGYVDFVEYFRVKSPGHIDGKDTKGRSSFFVACENGHILVVKYLMKYIHDFNAENSEKTTALSATCLNGHTEVAQLLLENKAETNKTNNSNQSTIHFACSNGNVKLVQLLLNGKYNVDLTVNDHLQNTALHIACEKGHSEIVKTLMELGLEVNQKQKHGKTPLYIACKHGYYKTVKCITDFICLKQKKRTIADDLKNLHTRKSGWTVLHSACNNGHTEVVKLLIDVGMTVNDLTIKGVTPLFLACKKGHNDTVKCLLDLKGQTLNMNVYNYTQLEIILTVLHIACLNGHTEVVKLLIDVGMNVNDTLASGSTPLHLACQEGHHAVVKLLLDLMEQTLNSCVDTTLKDKDGLSVLHVACLEGHTEVVKLLIDVGMNVNDKSTNGSTPIYLACQNGHYNTVKLLLGSNGQTLNSRVDTTLKTKCGWSGLHVACYNGHTEVVKLLIDVGMNVNDTLASGATPLYLACQEGHHAVVKLLLDLKEQPLNSCVDTTVKSEDGWSALHVTCSNGHTEVVKLLIDVGMNVNDKSTYASTPLYLACQNGHHAVVKLLLDLKEQTLNSCVDTTLKDKDGLSVLHVACLEGHTEVVKLLIDVGMNVNDKSTNGSTPIYLACQNGHYNTVKLLLGLNGQKLNSRVDTTLKTKCGWSGLHVACYNGYTEVVKLLIDVGMNVNDTLASGAMPLYLACQEGHHAVVKLLLDLKEQPLNSCVDTTVKNEDGWSALHVTCSNGHTEVVKLLIDVGMNVNDTLASGATPLYLACQEGHHAVVKLLLDLKEQPLNSCVDTTVKNEDGWSALHVTCSNEHTEVVKLLIDVGMNVNDKSTYGSTPLYLACQNGHHAVVKLLLDLKEQTLNSCVDTTLKDKDGLSVLHVACSEGHTEVVKLLIDVGMNVNEKSTNGSTPIYLACQNGHYNTVKLLIGLNGQTLNSCVDTTLKHKDGWSVLHAACSKGHTEVVKLLIDVGMNVNDKSTYGSTPLYLACQNGHYNTVKLLLGLNGQTLNSAVDTTLKTKYGWSVLHVACYTGHTEIVKLLIDVGMNVNDTTNNGSTPLYLACRSGKYDKVNFLLDLNGQTLNSRVDVTLKDKEGTSALHAAVSAGHSEIVKLFSDVGMNINDI